MVNESLQWWVDVRMSEHSVGAEWQVENQQVIRTAFPHKEAWTETKQKIMCDIAQSPLF